MDIVNEKTLENPKDLTITYRDKDVKIGELTEEEKIDCISSLWIYKGIIEDEKEVLQEMVQKMYLFGKMEKLEEEENN
ncbi:MAG: hypothetical protein OEM21_06565 [Nitrosopumilus sp.]|nr:hypothetical protein [Nitrosopumilus sp.]